MPARSLFYRRAWPEGYVFPSCARCNLQSADDELFMGFLVRIRIRASTPEERSERQKAIRGIHARHPTFFSSFERASRLETRRTAAQFGGFAALGADPGSVNVTRLPESALEAATRYGAKLARALHYMHTGKILSQQGEVDAFVYSNAADPGREIPDELFVPLAAGARPNLVRGAKDLGAQFRYRYLLIEGGAACAFLISFGESMTILGVTFEDRKSISASVEEALSGSIPP